MYLKNSNFLQIRRNYITCLFSSDFCFAVGHKVRLLPHGESGPEVIFARKVRLELRGKVVQMINDGDDRTTAIGLYHYGRSYHDSARVLGLADVRTTHPHAPVSYLYFHAIELFLKAYLRAYGHTVREMEKEFRHDIKRIRERASVLDFQFMDEDLVVLGYMESTDVVMKSRYIRTGYLESPTVEALERTASSLRETTCIAVREKSGVMVRS